LVPPLRPCLIVRLWGMIFFRTFSMGSGPPNRPPITSHAVLPLHALLVLPAEFFVRYPQCRAQTTVPSFCGRALPPSPIVLVRQNFRGKASF